MSDDKELLLGMAQLAALLDAWEARCDYRDADERVAREAAAELDAARIRESEHSKSGGRAC